MLDRVKDSIREMKVSMAGKERWDYLRRVEEIVGRLGIQDEQITQPPGFGLILHFVDNDVGFCPYLRMHSKLFYSVKVIS